MRVHQDWDTAAFGLPTVSAHLGPFPGRDFLRAVTAHRRGDGVSLVESDDGLLALHREGHTVRMAGPASLTDYHSPRGTDVPGLVARWWPQQPTGTALVWDSLPDRAARAVEEGLRAGGGSPRREQTEVAAVLHLPPTFDDYLHMVGKKERHEIRRKTRRYLRGLGEARHRTHRDPGWGMEEFIRLHRLASGAKGQFMDEENTRLFRRLAGLRGWRVDLLDTGDGAAACVFGYSDADCYYLYNSSFDPTYSALSPGVVLLSSMIEQVIGEGLTRFDFLKGNETYKRRLGAVHRPLYTVSCQK
ncbi:MAG: GNAT family N-acetyltransferase [bacterium]|nr:GNAT family N-acetyltransferase [Acidimicrobiia bacterium]MCY4650892.1 GNAT family N-acetyltransferase [bacterium]